MPELPEIEIIRRDLEKEVVGRRIKDVEVRTGRNAMKIIKRHGRRKEFQDLLTGAKVESIDRHGKWILLELDNDRVAVIDLGESGILVKTSASDAIVSHTHIVIGFTIGGQLRIVDPKLSGEIFVTTPEDLKGMDEYQGFLIDPLETPLAWQRFSAMLEDRKEAMKRLLADQNFVVGLGDLYSDEILFASGLRYDRPSNELSSQDVRRLYRSLMETLQDAVKARGTSLNDTQFTDLGGVSGQYQSELKVFKREGESCRRCRSSIVKESFDGKDTYFCPQCQS
ncbi:MAG: bifunctional DNA-formamidopyrimidine glycosylase/DNA-(apurinic or apyrimidinic site) lyase [Actinomycetota bacterium]|nr:bifunctional DNA-formamidopyrimidine glycosylase/DNA-(apurinic or apyrimidinic site) lyase [Actinomycetota bacterium]